MTLAKRRTAPRALRAERDPHVALIVLRQYGLDE